MAYLTIQRSGHVAGLGNPFLIAAMIIKQQQDAAAARDAENARIAAEAAKKKKDAATAEAARAAAAATSKVPAAADSKKPYTVRSSPVISDGVMRPDTYQVWRPDNRMASFASYSSQYDAAIAANKLNAAEGRTLIPVPPKPAPDTKKSYTVGVQQSRQAGSTPLYFIVSPDGKQSQALFSVDTYYDAVIAANKLNAAESRPLIPVPPKPAPTIAPAVVSIQSPQQPVMPTPQTTVVPTAQSQPTQQPINVTVQAPAPQQLPVAAPVATSPTPVVAKKSSTPLILGGGAVAAALAAYFMMR